MAGSNNGPGHNYLSRRAVIKHLRSNDRSTGAAGFKGFGMLPNKRKQNTGTYHSW